MTRLSGLSGVGGVAVVRETHSEQPVAVNEVSDPTATHPNQGLRHQPCRLRSPRHPTGWDRWHDETGERVVVLSPTIAGQLGIPDVQIGDRIYIQHVGYTVAGIL